jgi:hypothetical protein
LNPDRVEGVALCKTEKNCAQFLKKLVGKLFGQDVDSSNGHQDVSAGKVAVQDTVTRQKVHPNRNLARPGTNVMIKIAK